MDAQVLDMVMVGIKVQRLDGGIVQWNLPNIRGAARNSSISSTSGAVTLRSLLYEGGWDGTAGPLVRDGTNQNYEPDYYKLLATGNSSSPGNNLYLMNDDDVTWEADCGGNDADDGTGADGDSSSSSNPFLARDNVALGCTVCVFVDADGPGNGDVDGNGSRERPWKTLEHAEAAAGSDVDGVVLHGTFVIASPHTFRAGWSFTGYGTATTIYPVARKARALYVERNAFYRLVLDMSRVEVDQATFAGAQVALHNVVIRHQTSDDGSRELLYYDDGGGRDNDGCRLVLDNVLLYNVEYNLHVYPADHDTCAEVVGAVAAGNTKSSAKYTLRNTEDVVVDNKSYKIIEGSGAGGGDAGAASSKKNANVGVYAGKWSFDLRVVDNRGGDTSRRYQSTCIGTPHGLIKMGNGPENIGADHGVCMIGKKHTSSWGFLVVKMWVLRPTTTTTTTITTTTTTTRSTATPSTTVPLSSPSPLLIAPPQAPASQEQPRKSRAAAVAIPLTLVAAGVIFATAYYYGILSCCKRSGGGATNAGDELQQTHAIEMTENPLHHHRHHRAIPDDRNVSGADAEGIATSTPPLAGLYSEPDEQVQLAYSALGSGDGARMYTHPDERVQEMYTPPVPPDGGAGGGSRGGAGRKERPRYVNHAMMAPTNSSGGGGASGASTGGAGAGAGGGGRGGGGYVNHEMVAGDSHSSQLYAVPMEDDPSSVVFIA